jgi:hypothetical protein
MAGVEVGIEAGILASKHVARSLGCRSKVIQLRGDADDIDGSLVIAGGKNLAFLGPVECPIARALSRVDERVRFQLWIAHFANNETGSPRLEIGEI